MIVCCGEALIDMLPRESAAGEPVFAPHPGGAVFNTAVALGRLGAPVEFFGGLSSDLFGGMLKRALEESHVGTRHAHVSARPTTLAFVMLSDGQARYAFYDEGTAGRMLTTSDLPTLDVSVQAMLFGAISLVPEPCGFAFETLMRREAGARVIMLDPNIRPDFIPDKGLHRARLMRMAALADVVKLSDDDLRWFGEQGSNEEIAMRWLDRGAKLVLFTHGGDGAQAFTRSHHARAPARKVAIVDTVGAGDTFNAGVLASLHENGLLTKPAIAALTREQVAAALDLGVRAGAATVSRAGANPPWRAEL